MNNKHSNDFLKEEPVGSIVKKPVKRETSHVQRKKGSSLTLPQELGNYEEENIVINSSQRQPQQGEFKNGLPDGSHQQSSNSYGFGRQYDAAKFRREMLEFNNDHFINLYRGRIDAYW